MKIILSYFQQSHPRQKVQKLRHLPETLRAEHRRKNALSFLKRKSGARKTKKARSVFLRCPPRLCEAGGGA